MLAIKRTYGYAPATRTQYDNATQPTHHHQNFLIMSVIIRLAHGHAGGRNVTH